MRPLEGPTKFSAGWHFCQFAAGLWVLGLLLVLVGCATPPAQQTFVDEPRSGPVPAGTTGRPVVALVLSGGSARGFAHIGVITALEQAGISPDLVVGSSVGSIVAAAYASGMNARELVNAARAMDSTTLTDFTIPNLGQPFIRGELGFVRGQRLQAYVNRLVGNRALEALPRRLAVVATDLQSGQTVVFTEGNTGLAVRASSAIPGVFVPPLIRGRLYMDGQVSSPVPVTAARTLGADIVIAVDATFPPDHAEISNTVDVLFQSITIATQRIKDYELGLASIVIRPDIKTSGQLSLSDREMLMAEGERAARAALPELFKVLGLTNLKP